MDNDDDDGVATNLTAKEIEQEAKEVGRRRGELLIEFRLIFRQLVQCKKANQHHRDVRVIYHMIIPH